MSKERIAEHVGPDDLELAWEERDGRKDPTVLLVMRVAAQLVHWPAGFLDASLARGLHLVRVDNRDAGRSTHMRAAPPLADGDDVDDGRAVGRAARSGDAEGAVRRTARASRGSGRRRRDGGAGLRPRSRRARRRGRAVDNS